MRATHVELRLSALRHNLSVVRRLAPDSRVMAAVKADAYGHGLIRAARALVGADALGVAAVGEALHLREAGIESPITLLEGFFRADELTLIQRHRLDTVVHQFSQIELLEQASLEVPIGVWLKVNSGMHRLGFEPSAAGEAWRRLERLSHVRLLGGMTHLANADELSDPTTPRQIETYLGAMQGLTTGHSIGNSAGIIGWPNARTAWVRPGIMLYGVSPFPGRAGADEGLQPVMTLRSELIAVNWVKAGSAVGYGGTWASPEDMPVGVVAVGYGDGYPRHACSGTPVLVNDRRVPLIGRVSMDMITVDLRTQPRARVGDPVVLWGESLAVEEIASCAGTIGYELLCGIAPRVPRVELP